MSAKPAVKKVLRLFFPFSLQDVFFKLIMIAFPQSAGAGSTR
jgi:hypothetical protein